MTFLVASFIFCSTFTIAGTQTSLAIALALWVPLFAVRRSMIPRRTVLDLPLLLFVVVSVAAVLFSGELRDGFWNLRNYLLFGAVYLIVSVGRDGGSLRRMFTVLLVSACGSALYGIAIFILGMGDGTLGRTSGSFSNAMTFGGVMLLLCSLLFALATSREVRGRLRIAAVIAAVITALALFFSFTRSSWLGMLVSALIVLVIQRRRLLPIFIAGIAITVLILPARYRDRFTRISITGRISTGWK